MDVVGVVVVVEVQDFGAVVEEVVEGVVEGVVIDRAEGPVVVAVSTLDLRRVMSTDPEDLRGLTTTGGYSQGFFRLMQLRQDGRSSSHLTRSSLQLAHPLRDFE